LHCERRVELNESVSDRHDYSTDIGDETQESALIRSNRALKEDQNRQRRSMN
jgi:hypothetical protein